MNATVAACVASPVVRSAQPNAASETAAMSAA